MKLFVLGNKGSFFDYVRQILSATSVVDFYTIDKSESLFASKAIEYISLTEFGDYDAVIYISGETRDELCMHLLNFRLPSILIDHIRGQQVHFIYLSSLAVFAGNESDQITVNSPFSALDNYGETKILLERYRERFVSNNLLPKISVIYPASFFSGSGNSSIEKFLHFKSKYSLLRLFTFHGSLSFIERDKLATQISIIAHNKTPVKLILAENYLLNNSGGMIKIPRIPLLIFKLFGTLSKKLALKLRMVFRGINYE